MEDIRNRADLELLMATFYSALLRDEAISYIFTDVVKISLDEHLPHIVDFWEQLLFNTIDYRKSVFGIHQEIHQKFRLETAHFAIWLDHLNHAADMHFSGMKTEKLKTSALSIATIMQLKLS